MLRRTEEPFYTFDITIRICEYDMDHISSIKEMMGTIAAIRTIRMFVPQLTLKQAKNIIEEL